jgi:hypothetical protein
VSKFAFKANFSRAKRIGWGSGAENYDQSQFFSGWRQGMSALTVMFGASGNRSLIVTP